MYFAKQDMQNYFRVEHSTPIMFCGYKILAPKIIICLIRILDKNKQLVLSCNCILPIYFLFKFQFNSISEQKKNVSFHFFNFGKKKKEKKKKLWVQQFVLFSPFEDSNKETSVNLQQQSWINLPRYGEIRGTFNKTSVKSIKSLPFADFYIITFFKQILILVEIW